MDYFLTKNVIFKNINKLPLNELNLEVNTLKRTKKTTTTDLDKSKDNLKDNYETVREKHPALHSSWIQQSRQYRYYQPYFVEVSPDENAQFITRNRQFGDCLDFLIQCSFQQFWCYFTYEPRVVKLLKSFLYNASPWYELDRFDEKTLNLYNEIYNKIAKILTRLIIYKSSDTEYMSESTILRLIDESELLTLPIIMNMCILYKNSNQNLINDYITLYFRADRKPKYMKELQKMLEQVLVIFEVAGGEVCGYDDERRPFVQIGIRHKPKKFDPQWYEEVVLFLLDTAANLNAFLSVCKPAVELGIKLEMPTRLAYFYNKVYPTIYKDISGRNLSYDWTDLQARIKKYVALNRSEFSSCFHAFIAHFIDGIVQAQCDNLKQAEFIEQYISLISATLDDEFFMFDYHNCYEIDLQLQMIADFYPELDTMRTNYIMECLSTFPNSRDLIPPLIEEKKPDAILIVASIPSTSSITPPRNNDKQISEDEIEKNIHIVLDTLPYLGDEFVLRCLEVYNYDPYSVISAVLDNNLSPLVRDLPQDAIRVPPEQPDPQPKPILAYTGKKPTYDDAVKMLDDKRDMDKVKKYVLQTSRMVYDMYDDEYDDREDVEPKKREKDDDPYKYMENRFNNEYELVSDPSEGSSEDEAASATKFVPFCQDPAAIREKREAKFRNRGHSDVVGKARGQGQDKQVLQNRDKKTVNKSSRANHNRKSGAQWKRNKGMFPS